jgi:hypothetical protein
MATAISRFFRKSTLGLKIKTGCITEDTSRLNYFMMDIKVLLS